MPEESKKMTPKELEHFYSCRGDKDHPACPIFDFCFHGDGKDYQTCQSTWKKYLKLQEKNLI